jgi:hypothetical protein
MKRTAELDTLKIAERLSVESRKVRLAALATGGLDGEDAGPIEFLLFEIEEEIDSIAETVHPGTRLAPFSLKPIRTKESEHDRSYQKRWW